MKTISIDTNILARYFLGDDVDQQEMALQLLSHYQCFVPITVTLELAWVLQSYDKSKLNVIESILILSKLPTITLEHKQAIISAMRWAMEGMDIADAIHLAIAKQYNYLPLSSFDKRFINKSNSIDDAPMCQTVKSLIEQ